MRCKKKIAYLGKLISDIFQATDRGHDPREGIWNDPIGLVILSVHSIIYCRWKIWNQNQDMQTSNTNERKWQQPQFQSHYQASWHLRIHLVQYGLLWWLSLDNEDVFINPNFLWRAHSLNISSFLYYGTFLSIWCTFPPCFTQWLWHCQSCTSCSGAISYLGIFF